MMIVKVAKSIGLKIPKVLDIHKYTVIVLPEQNRFFLPRIESSFEKKQKITLRGGGWVRVLGNGTRCGEGRGGGRRRSALKTVLPARSLVSTAI